MSHKLISFAVIFFLAFSVPYLIASELFASDITVLFSPRDECGKVILDKINQAEKSIELAMYHITSRTLSRALVLAAERGVKVRAFLDGESAGVA